METALWSSLLVLHSDFKSTIKNLLCLLVAATLGGVWTGLSAPIETIQRDGSQAKPLRQSDVTDTVFRTSDLSGVPTDLERTAEFSTGEGNSFAVHGFVNDSGEFVGRFTPPTEGAWQYGTCSTLDQLAGIHGKLMAGAPRVGLVIDADRSTRFRYENGESC